MLKNQPLSKIKHFASKRLNPLEGCLCECRDHTNRSVYWCGFKDNKGNLVGFTHRHIDSLTPFPSDITEITAAEMLSRQEIMLEQEFTSFE